MNMPKSYSNRNILNMFYLYGLCKRIISQNCQIFNEKYPHLVPINSTKVRRIDSNFLQFTNQEPQCRKNRLVVNEAANERIRVNDCHAYRQALIRRAFHDLGFFIHPFKEFKKMLLLNYRNFVK